MRASGRCDVVWTDRRGGGGRRVVHRSYVRRPLVVARLAHDGGLAVAGGIVSLSCASGRIGMFAYVIAAPRPQEMLMHGGN